MADGEMSRRELIKLVGAGAVGFLGGCDFLKNRDRDLPEKYSYLGLYNGFINWAVGHLNRKHGRDLDSNLVKSQIVVESGALMYRSGDVRDDAFFYDPLQIANKGDYALSVLSNSRENTYLIDNFDFLKGKRHTLWNKEGFWDYSNSNMTWRDSVRGGVGWLFHKAAKYDKKIFEEGNVEEYIVKGGDNLWKISKKVETLPGVLEKYTKEVNLNFVPDKICPGDRLRFRRARESIFVSGWRDWWEAIERYNGGGDSNYLTKVERVYSEIKKC